MSIRRSLLVRLLLLLVLVGALGACGAKGALYLPKGDGTQQQG